MSTASTERKNITIIGGGIIGCTSAYYLTRHPSFSTDKYKVTLLEASDIAGGASGKAGGLLATWAYPANLVSLSFNLHAELAKEHNGPSRWGYRHVECGELVAKGRKKVDEARAQGQKDSAPLPKRSELSEPSATPSLHDEAAGSKAAAAALKAKGAPADLDWISPDSFGAYDEMSPSGTTAQVHPYLFTTSMAELAKQAGVDVVTNARVTSINTGTGSASSSSSPQVQSVTYKGADGEDKTVPTDIAVLAAGAWTSHLHSAVPIMGQRAHSVTITPARPVSAYALFTSIKLPSGYLTRPEIYTRPNNEIYACGEGDSTVPLPETTRDVEVDPKRCEAIVEAVGSISDELCNGAVTARQACYLPVSRGGGGPWIGNVSSINGLVLAAGHTCWGIQNGPATGKLVSEIVIDGQAKSAKLGQLEPRNM